MSSRKKNPIKDRECLRDEREKQGPKGAFQLVAVYKEAVKKK